MLLLSWLHCVFFVLIGITNLSWTPFATVVATSVTVATVANDKMGILRLKGANIFVDVKRK